MHLSSMSSTAFDSAVRALVRVHIAEINQLQQQLAHPCNSNPESLPEHACSIKSVLHTYPKGPSTPRHMTSSSRQMLSTANQKPSTPRIPFTPKPLLDSQAICAEHTCEATEPCECDDQSEQSGDDHQGHKMSLMRWGTLVQGLLGGRDSVFVVREGWEMTIRASGHSRLSVALTAVLSRSQDKKKAGGPHSTATLEAFGFQQGRLVVRPDSFARRLWMSLSLLVILYEIVALTMEPFDVFGKDKSSVFELISVIYWTSDIIFNFFIGIYIHGKLEVRMHMIAKHYLCTWFGFDFTIVAMHVLSMLVATGGASSSGTLFKIIRAVRALRLGRMLSWVRLAFEKVLSKRTSVFASKVAQSLVALYFFVHLNACLWYEIGDRPTGWVADNDSKLGDSAGLKYLLAMHWSLSQLQGNVDIHPGRSAGDRVFAVLSLFASIIFLALLVSIITGSLFSLRDERKAWLKQKHMVESFLDRHRIKATLRKRAEYHLELRKNAEHSVYEDQDRRALEMFPPQLKWQLLAASRASILEWHPLFLYLKDFHASLFASVCNDAIFWHASEPEDDIFMSFTSSMGAYYIASGEFVFNARLDLFGVLNPWVSSFFATVSDGTQGRCPEYSRTTKGTGVSEERRPYESSNSQKNMTSVTRLYKGQLLTEISLWTPWVHTGDMSALSHGQCFSVRWSELLIILKESSEPFQEFCSYATHFVDSIQELHSGGVSRQEVELLGFADVLGIRTKRVFRI